MSDQNNDETRFPITGYETRYEIAKSGRIWALERWREKDHPQGARVTEHRRHREMKPFTRSDGKQQIVLCDSAGIRHCHYMTSLLRRTFGEGAA